MSAMGSESVQLYIVVVVASICIFSSGVRGATSVTPAASAVLFSQSATFLCTSSIGSSSFTLNLITTFGTTQFLFGLCSTESMTPPFNTNGQYSLIGGSGYCNVTIVKATLAQAGNYTCGDGTSVSVAQVVVLDSSPACIINASNGTVVNGDHVQLDCSVTYNNGGSSLYPLLTWTLANSTSTQDHNNTFAHSSVTTQATQSGVPPYLCALNFSSIATPPSYQAHCTSPAITDVPHCPTNASITGASPGGSIDYGNNLTCHASANPPATYNWFNAITTTGPTIVITAPGSYYCMAINFVQGSTCSNTVIQTIVIVTSIPTSSPSTSQRSDATSTSNFESTITSHDTTGGCDMKSGTIAAIVLGSLLMLSLIAIAALVILLTRTRRQKSGNPNGGSHAVTNDDSSTKPKKRCEDNSDAVTSGELSVARKYEKLDNETRTENTDEIEDYEELELSPDKSHIKYEQTLNKTATLEPPNGIDPPLIASHPPPITSHPTPTLTTPPQTAFPTLQT